MQTLSNLLMIVKSVAVSVGKMLYLLLFRLYLVIPTLYLICIWIASACVPFQMSAYSTYIIVGVVLATGISVLLILRRVLIPPVPRKKKPKTTVVPTEDIDTGYEEKKVLVRNLNHAQFVPPPGYVPPPTPYAPTYGVPPTDYPTAPPQPAFAQPATEPLSQKPTYRGPAAPDYYENHTEFETPKYYRSRRDPSLYIAEYSDKLEFYRKTEDGKMHFLDTEFKTN